MLFGADLIFSLIVFSWHAMVEQSTILIYYTINKIILFLQCVINCQTNNCTWSFMCLDFTLSRSRRFLDNFLNVYCSVYLDPEIFGKEELIL